MMKSTASDLERKKQLKMQCLFSNISWERNICDASAVTIILKFRHEEGFRKSLKYSTMGLNSRYVFKDGPTWKRKIFSNKSLNVSDNRWIIITTLHWVLFVVWGKFNMQSMKFSRADSRVRMWRFSDVSGTTSVPIFSTCWWVCST